VLSHRDVILNVILNRIIWSTTSSQLSHRGERYTHHMGTPNHWGTTQLSHRGERCPNHWGTTQLSHRGERCPITWVCPTLGSLSGRLNSVTEENVSWRMSHDAAIINIHHHSYSCYYCEGDLPELCTIARERNLHAPLSMSPPCNPMCPLESHCTPLQTPVN
jgi:hypothetical protein